MCVRCVIVCIINIVYVYVQQFQFGVKVSIFKGVFVIENMVNGDLCYFVVWCYQIKYMVVLVCVFIDGVDIWIGSLVGIINDNIFMWSNVQIILGCQFIVWMDIGREDDKVDFQFVVVGKMYGFMCFDIFLYNFKGVFVGVNVYVYIFDFVMQLFVIYLIKLFCYQYRGKFDNVGFNI